jgi:hypothetical protein
MDAKTAKTAKEVASEIFKYAKKNPKAAGNYLGAAVIVCVMVGHGYQLYANYEESQARIAREEAESEARIEREKAESEARIVREQAESEARIRALRLAMSTTCQHCHRVFQGAMDAVEQAFERHQVQCQGHLHIETSPK